MLFCILSGVAKLSFLCHLASFFVRAAGNNQGEGSAREALAVATSRVHESDAAANALQGQVRERLQSSHDGDSIRLVLDKAATSQNSLRHKSVKQYVRIRNASQSGKFRSILRVLSRSLEPYGTIMPPAKSLACDLRWRPGAFGVAAFMHIGKAAGTAFRRAILNRPAASNNECILVPHRIAPDISIHRATFSVGRLQWRYTKGHKHEYGDGPAWEFHIPELLATRTNETRKAVFHKSACLQPVPCLCTAHYDFSLLDALYKALPDGSVAGLALLRDPVDRFLSHFYHAQRLEWTAGLRIRQCSPLEFLQEPDSMLDALMVWQDGVSGVSWWAGETVHFGMGATGDLSDNLRIRATIHNRTETLKKAVYNYHRFAFVGILEDMNASLELLQHVLAWKTPPILERLNAGDPNRPVIADSDRRKLRTLLRVLAPMDMWFYEYVKADFQGRVAMLREAREVSGRPCHDNNNAIIARIPSESELGGCVATREAIACGRDVFMKHFDDPLEQDHSIKVL